MKFFFPSLLLPLAFARQHSPAVEPVTHHDADLLSEYDYVVVGGGVSGLTVANRLTEDSSKTVLVIEAGKIDNYSKEIQYPRFARTVSANYSWPITSLPTAGLNNRTASVVVARILGGGSAINGMAFMRGSPGDYDLWAELIGDKSWGWDGLLPYFKKSETFTPPTDVQQSQHGISFDIDARGTNGPIQSSFPPFITSTGKVFLAALRQLGIPTQIDGSANALGGYWSPNSLDPVTRERSYARTGYHDSANIRSNYHVLPEALVTKLTADLTGVEYIPEYNTALNSTPPDVKIKTVRARKEIIMAAGAIHTPKILHLSGVGSSSVIRSLGIDQILDVPGVGENLQDHATIYGSVAFTNLSDPTQDPVYIWNNATYDAEMGLLYEANRTGPWTVGTENTFSFLTAKQLNFPVSHFAHAAGQPAGYLRSGLDPSIIRGYEKSQNLLLKYMADNKVALSENLLITIISLQKPLSRGFVHAGSTDPYTMPHVSYRTFSNPLDLEMLAQAVRLHTDLLPQTPALQSIGAVLEFPKPGLTNTELMDTIKESADPSFYHPVGTCAMLKFGDGGCVDSQLRLYGSRGRVRVVDASIFPTIPSAHTQSTVYAVAEKAADLIRGIHTAPH